MEYHCTDAWLNSTSEFELLSSLTVENILEAFFSIKCRIPLKHAPPIWSNIGAIILHHGNKLLVVDSPILSGKTKGHIALSD